MDQKELDEIYNKADIVAKVRNELAKETDRGCCLMAASYLEQELQELLKKKLAGSKKVTDGLFDFNGPLGTFSSKIKLCYTIGLITKNSMADLEIIRKIRNEFGHKHEPINFDSPSIRQQVGKLRSHFYEEGEARPRAVFTNTFSSILAEIHATTITHEGFKEKKETVAGSQTHKTDIKNHVKGVVNTLFIQLLEGLKAENPRYYTDEVIQLLYEKVTTGILDGFEPPKKALEITPDSNTQSS